MLHSASLPYKLRLVTSCLACCRSSNENLRQPVFSNKAATKPTIECSQCSDRVNENITEDRPSRSLTINNVIHHHLARCRQRDHELVTWQRHPTLWSLQTTLTTTFAKKQCSRDTDRRMKLTAHHRGENVRICYTTMTTYCEKPWLYQTHGCICGEQ